MSYWNAASRRTERALAALLLCLLGAGPLTAQEAETNLFGSLQAIFFTQKSRITLNTPLPDGTTTLTEERNSFAIQQLDIFLQRQIDDNFSAFVDMEYQLNYSSDHRWGSMSLQEAWLQYSHSDAFNVKLGLLYPAFNHLNEIKNRLALLPYIFRPGVYERLLSNLYRSEDYIPEHAFVQLSGAVPSGDFFWDWAVYVGNAEDSYISRTDADGNIRQDLDRKFEFLSGVDPTNADLKLIGGRTGFRSRTEHFKVGLSFTHDYDNLRDTTRYPMFFTRPRAEFRGDARRMRLGADLSGSVGGVRFEGEFINVFYDYDLADKAGFDMNLTFAHGMLGYWFTDKLFTYGSAEFGTGTFDKGWSHSSLSFGASYLLNSAISAKAQFIVHEQRHDEDEDRAMLKFVFLGLSVLL